MEKTSLLINPISMPAGNGETLLAFPSHHLLSRWYDVTGGSKECNPKPGVRDASAPCLNRLGRFGDTVRFAELPKSFRIPELAALAGATVAGGGVYDGSET